MSKERFLWMVLRVSLGIVFLLFGVGKFQNDIWAQTIRAMAVFQGLPWNMDLTLYLIGASEIAIGVSLITGVYYRLFAALASLQLLSILILLNFSETRDIALLGSAFFLAVQSPGSVRQERSSHKWRALALFLILTVVITALAFYQGRDKVLAIHDHAHGQHAVEQSTKDVQAENAAYTGHLKEGVRVVEVHAYKYRFEPEVITLKKGQPTRIELSSMDVAHGLFVPDLSVNVTASVGEKGSVEFVPQKAGQFEGFCSVYCGKGHAHMTATVVVTE